ncbi:CDP-alcohol phosphatidyltransferase family protein [Mesorhizobium calcicola]|uniref:CDP-alcohol phosphatidyltransferase family protein n=1 Tax=Mesorhizobium calcicola TaxID=1300310 RepID=A0ABW4WFL2_9HYPH
MAVAAHRFRGSQAAGVLVVLDADTLDPGQVRRSLHRYVRCCSLYNRLTLSSTRWRHADGAGARASTVRPPRPEGELRRASPCHDGKGLTADDVVVVAEAPSRQLVVRKVAKSPRRLTGFKRSTSRPWRSRRDECRPADVLIPAFALYQRGFMGEGLSFLSAAIIVVSSAIYYADTGMKTKENFFKGFPVVWNMVVFTLFVIEPGQWVSFAVVVVAGILTFVPINFIHPVRVVRLRRINLAMTLLWCAFGALALAQAALAAFYDQIGVLGEQVGTFTKIGITITGLYLASIGGIMQFFPNLGAKKA